MSFKKKEKYCKVLVQVKKLGQVLERNFDFYMQLKEKWNSLKINSVYRKFR